MPPAPWRGTRKTAAKNSPAKRHARASLMPKYRNSTRKRRNPDKSACSFGWISQLSSASKAIGSHLVLDCCDGESTGGTVFPNDSIRNVCDSTVAAHRPAEVMPDQDALDRDQLPH